jgi:restriction endonuclease S subunit
VKLSQSLTFYRDEYEEISKHYDPKYLLAVMNSTFARNFLNERRSSKLDIYPDDWKQLPIPVASKDEQHAISRLVTKLCESIQSGAKSTELSTIEAKIDAAVNDVIRRTSR